MVVAQVRADYLDVSEPNIHPVWETTILLWVEKLPWLKQRTKPDFEERTRNSLVAYLKTKPYGRRQHPAMDEPIPMADDYVFNVPPPGQDKARMEDYNWES